MLRLGQHIEAQEQYESISVDRAWPWNKVTDRSKADRLGVANTNIEGDGLYRSRHRTEKNRSYTGRYRQYPRRCF